MWTFDPFVDDFTKLEERISNYLSNTKIEFCPLKTPQIDFDFQLSLNRLIKSYKSGHFKSSYELGLILRTVAWEKLNSWHWADVPSVWRQAYYFVSLILVISRLLLGHDCLSVLVDCDHALLMGCSFGDDVISGIALILHDMVGGGNEVCLPPAGEEGSLLRFEYLTELPRVENIGVEDFIYYFNNQLPCVITGSCGHWPAFSDRRWNVQYFMSLAQHRTVPVEIGKNYMTDHNWHQKLMFFKDFVNDYIINQSPVVGYLAQHNLLGQIPVLNEDVITPEYCYVSDCDDRK
ncbi:bifunctional peptidase and arginyl-hydroxylase JMJD5-like [Octopus sinensis]|uniref:Bifunctional peptidase and arginyl-hydroxylase JMJD5-like n=1 Tax=Octopus sinensis TaxID=2607531 RepID=A0A6P7U054_9MOLL|nr:bifunctional peptidase and arginyl-hydroxylase JMJD5-like [Octopus sinensis]